MKSKQLQNKLKLNSKTTTEKGFLSLTERQLVDSSIQTFLSMNNLEKEDMHWILHPRLSKSFQNKRKPQFKNFSATIQEMSGLNRTPKQIYWYMRRAYSELREHDSSVKKPRQGWTKQEDEDLQRLILLKGLGNWVEIEKCMGKLGAKDRYDCLLSKKNGKWSLDEEKKMVEIANDIMKRDKITDKTKFKSWTELASRLQTRTYRECRRHYLLLGPTLEAKKFTFGYQDYEDLLLRLIFHYETINDESDILWSSMINQSDIWSAEHFREAWNTLKKKIRKTLGTERLKQMPFMNSVCWALEHLSEIVHHSHYVSSQIEFKEKRPLINLDTLVEEESHKFGYQDYDDLLLRLIFHYETINDESDILWSSMINQSDIWTAEQFKEAWKTLKGEIKKRVGPERFKEMSFMNLVHWALEHLAETTK